MQPVPGTITDPAVDRLLAGEDTRSPATGHQLQRLAHALATVAHAGQSRKGEGEPYVRHVERVAGRVGGWRAKTIAYLHDLIEDTPITEADLLRIGFPADVVRDVVALTRLGGETYTEFISRTLDTGSEDALRVKLADLQDNLTDPWASETKLAERYLPAARRVTEELKRRRTA